MNTVDKKFLLNHGFKEDADKKILLELFTNHNKFREVNISVELTEPSMLLARSNEKNVTVDLNSVQDNRLILKRKRSREKFDTIIMDILLDEIHNCLVEEYRNGLFDFEFEVRDFRYSLHIFI